MTSMSQISSEKHRLIPVDNTGTKAADEIAAGWCGRSLQEDQTRCRILFLCPTLPHLVFILDIRTPGAAAPEAVQAAQR